MSNAEHTETRDPAEIEREIRQTQAEMGRTVDKIGDQLTPRNLLNALLDKADENGIDARYLVDGARRNPLALGMIALGGIWLVSDSDARPSTLKPSGIGGWTGSEAHYDHHRGYIEHMSRCEPQANEDEASYRRRRDLARANYLMIEQRHDEDESSFRQRLDQATDALRERRDSLLDQAHRMGRTASESAGEASDSVMQAYRSNPLVGGMIAALVGALAGAAAPVTRTEEGQIGKFGADALDAAKEKARELADVARDKKDELVDKADQRMAKGRGGPSVGDAPGVRAPEYGTV
ncbi:hypothetical protein GCM10011515_06750 [Tsuneonella deserti]|uniref:DUF3618 domain-containing protein n=1 Tax=Tsuneonella deserti TaxID=2035528 RepID=A0ABQ1S3V5_9SPHN|nr:DUF3618 domain-containing protein [Tsuneonella deserti]GGD89789.1 hypothetical protein GCM10011515_06750 [Tsuneonella deserti]